MQLLILQMWLLPLMVATFSRGPSRLASTHAYDRCVTTATTQLRGSSSSTSSLRSSSSGSSSDGVSDEEEIRRLYEKAQLEDAEWLRRVFEESAFPLPPNPAPADSAASDEAPSAAPVAATSTTTSTAAETETTTTAALVALGYSPADIAAIKESVLQVIVEKAVNRPRKGLPDSWLKRVDGGDRSARGSPPPPPSPLRATKAPGVGEVGEAFAWAGTPPTDNEVSRGRRLREASIRARQYGADIDEGEDPEAGEEEEAEEWVDARDRDRDGPAPFWPDADEFKNMLIDESQWRVGIVGDWSKPFVKAETKWRYGLYKSWLQFLDEGIGDGFDVVADGFEEYYYDQGNADGDDVDDDDDAVYDDVDDGYGDDEGGYRAPTRQPPVPPTREPRMSKAEAYDRWVRSRVGAGADWVDMSVEERRARAELRAAVMRREEEDAEEEFRARRRRRRAQYDEYDDEDVEERRGMDATGAWLDDDDNDAGGERRESRQPRRPRPQSPSTASRRRPPPPTRRGNAGGSGAEITSEEEYQQAWQRSAERAPVALDDLDP